MSRDDLIKMEGKVCDATGGGNYKILLDNGKTVFARLSGRMKRYKIRIILGDTVTVGLSPYDLEHGLITYRKRT
ncbi:MAG: translation initiation factor IF-1 [bacterium]|nr:MAG: translation initiation factor IF-1 [bacterium]